MEKTKNILITGSTGFVGSHVLKEVVTHKDIKKIYLLIRNKSGKDHFFESLKKYALDFTNEEIKKIEFISGDVSKFKLGINSHNYTNLYNIIDVIYHVAADVNHVKKYEDLKKSNVDCLNDLIDLSQNGNKKIINFVSTMAAASEKDSFGFYTEDFVGESPSTLSMGYLKTKYEAEKILSSAKSDSSINIFRLGYISGNLENGVSLCEKNQMMLFIKSCIQLGFSPILTRDINLTPVDFTAKILGSPFFREKFGHVFHLVNNREYVTWIELMNFLNEFGYKIKLIELSEWQKKLIASGKDNALYRMLLTYRRKDADDHIIRFGKNIHEYHINNINNFCEREKIIIPKIKYNYIKKIFEYLIDIGFLPNPRFLNES